MQKVGGAVEGIDDPATRGVRALDLGAYSLARYYRFRYGIKGDTLRVESGVFARQSREIPLGRIQNVDITEGVVNRVLSLSVVAFETAGGSATEATLSAVDPAEAERLRRLVQRHGEDEEPEPHDRTETEPGVATQPQGETVPERTPADTEELFTFGPRDLLTYALVSVRPAALVLLVAGLPLGIDVLRTVLQFNLGVVGSDAPLGPAVVEAVGPPRLAVLGLLTLVQVGVVALLVSVVLTVVEYYDFSLVRDGDDLRYQRGLVRRYSGTIPLEKVQTVTVRENVLMRQFGFATLVVETAGYSGGSQQSTQGVAVPMAPRTEVYDLARDIEPFDELAFERPPKRARRRYAARFAIVVGVVVALVAAVDTLLLSGESWWPLLGLFVLVPPAAHLRWRQRGYALDDDLLATRTGFWRQTTRLVPYYRIQTVFVGRSPFQRRRNLATVTADTASTTSVIGGSATAYDVDDSVAADLRDDLRRRLYRDLLARRAERDSPDQ